MAAILLSACQVDKIHGEFAIIKIRTPSTADSNDTIDISALIPADTNLEGIHAWDCESGDSATCTYATGTGIVTLDAAGGTTDHTYSVVIYLGGAAFTA